MPQTTGSIISNSLNSKSEDINASNPNLPELQYNQLKDNQLEPF